MKIYNVTRAREVARHAEVAATWLSRAKGLLGRSRLDPGQGLVITPCNSIHTFFMRFPIDVIFADRQGRVIHLRRSMRPWRVSRIVRRAHLVVELPAGTIMETGTAEDDELAFEED